MTPPRLHYLLFLTLCTFAVISAGCDRKDQIETYSVPKTLAVSSEPIADAGDTIAAPKWTVPDGWTYVPGRDMRYASFRVSQDHPDVELTVVPLDSAGGTLLDNLHRWQKQLGLEPSPVEDLKKIMTSADLSGTPAGVFDLTGAVPSDGTPQQRMLAAIVPQPTQTWFFKLMGPIDVVSAQKDNFDRFIHSLKFEGAAQEAGAPEPAEDAVPATQQSPISYVVPAGWTQQTQANQFRVVAFNIPVGNQSGAVIVARMPVNSGTVLDNINRWRQQVNLPPLTDEAQIPAQTLKIGGLDAMMWDMHGDNTAQPPHDSDSASQQGDAVAGSGLPESQRASSIVVAMLTRGSEWWFFKLQGPAAIVTAQKETFMTFLQSVQFSDAAP